MRNLYLIGFAICLGAGTCTAQPPPPPPADPTWSSTEGPAWNSFACPDGSVIFSAHLGGPKSLFFSDVTGEVELARQRTGEETLWVGEGVVEKNEPERRKRVTFKGTELGGGACVSDRSATIQDRLNDAPGVWIADARMNPKPERVGLHVPDGFQNGDFRQALFVGRDRIEITALDIQESIVAPSDRAERQDIAFRFTPSVFETIIALQNRHAVQPLALLIDGQLIAEVRVSEQLAAGRVLAVYSLDDTRLRNIQEALNLSPAR